MEKFEKNEDKKLRSESMVDDVAFHRGGKSIDKTGNAFRVSQRHSDIYKDSQNNKNELMNIAKKSENIERRKEYIEKLKEKKKRYEILARNTDQLKHAIENIEEIDRLINDAETLNEIDGIENEGLMNKLSSGVKSKPEENIWKN